MVKNMAKKIFVVTLKNGSKRNPAKDKLIVKAENKESAIASAKRISVRVLGKCIAYADEACPISDLGCLTKTQTFELHAQIRTQILDRSTRLSSFMLNS